jgi:hypothetical protein
MSPTPPNPRQQPRRRILKSGMICFNARHSTLPCVVRDFSETGAKLTVSGSINAPDTFELFIELDGIWVDCAVAWRKPDQIGVRFTSPIKHADPARKQVVTATVEPKKISLRRVPKA